jgi:apolipoprotein N-acyltransferase
VIANELRRRIVPSGAVWPFGSGVLLTLACPPFHLLAPSFVGLVPFLVWLEERPTGEAGRSEARRGGFLLGAVGYSLTYYWLAVSLVRFTPLSVLFFLGIVLLLASLLALVAGAARVTRDELGWPLWVVFPVFWTGYEWLRAHLPDVAFPWMQLGDTLTGFPWLVGAADLVGSRGLTFWLATVNALVATAVVTWRQAGARAALSPHRLVALLLVLGLPIAYSLVRWTTLPMRATATVAIIQPNIPEELKLDRPAAIRGAQLATDALLFEVVSDSVPLDLLVLPETVLPWHVEPIVSRGDPGRPDLEAWVAALVRRSGADVLYGALGVEDRGDGEYDYLNSAFLVDETGGRVARYDKQYLVPGMERVPFLNPRWFGGLEYLGGFARGRSAPPLGPPGRRFGVMICYESIFTGLGRHYRRNGADFLVNVTNDAWFGGEEWWSRTSALWQHPAHLVMRTIETRIGAARAANTGISAVVDPLGRVGSATRLFVPAAFAAEVLTTDGRTVFVRLGDVVGTASAVTAGLLLLGLWHRRRSEA